MKKILLQFQLYLAILYRHPLYLKYHYFIVPVFSFLCCILIFFFLTLPQIFKIGGTNSKIKDVKAEQTQAQNKIKSLDKIDLDMYKNNLNDSLVALPSDKDIPGAVNSVLDLLSNSGLKLDNFSFSTNPLKDAGAESFVVKVDVTGTIDQIKNLITISNKSTRLIKIIGIALNNSQGQTAQASLDLVVFYALLDTNVGSSSNQVQPLSPAEQEIISKFKQTSVEAAPIIPNLDVKSGKSDPFN